VESHPVESGDSIFRLKRFAEIISSEGSVNIFRRRKLNGKGSYNYDRKLQPLGLVNCHDLNMPFWKREVRIFVFVDPALIEEPQEAMEEVKPEGATIPRRDNGIMIIVLEDVK
jgi:hypothetical protein